MQSAEKLSYSALQKGWTVYLELLYQLVANQSNAADLFCLFKSLDAWTFQSSVNTLCNHRKFCPCDSSILSIHSFNRVWEIIWNKHERRCENQLMKLRILGKSTWNGHEVSTMNQRTTLNREECHNKRWGNTRLQQLRTTVVGISWSAEPARIRRGQSFLCPWWPNYAPLLLTSPRLLLILCCGRAHALRLHSYTALSATSSLTNCCLTLIQHNEPRA